MYSEELLSPCVLATVAPQTAAVLTAAADIQVYNFGEQVIVTRVMFQVSAAVTAANAVVTVYMRPTYGSTVGQIAIGTLTVPTTAVAGQILYKNVESVKVPQGAQLAFTVTTAASATGAGFPMFKGFMAVEDPRNVSAMVLSA